jgi:hypothetical protein
VLEDLNDPPGGAMRGEWNANVHRTLGCVETITHGAVRDLDALERLGFHTFATSVSVAHGCGAFVGYGAPVTVAGLEVCTGGWSHVGRARRSVVCVAGRIGPNRSTTRVRGAHASAADCDLAVAAASAAAAPTPRVFTAELAERLELGGAEVGVLVAGRRYHRGFAGDVGVDAEEQSSLDLPVEPGLGPHATKRREHDHEQPHRRDSGDDSCKKSCHRDESYPCPAPALA